MKTITIHTTNSTDNRATIQYALDNAERVIIGASQIQEFALRRALYPKNNQIIEIHGTIKMTASVQQIVQADVNIGSYTVTVQDGTQYQIGDYVAISDDLQPPVGGGAGQTRKMSLSRIVTNIVGNVLYFAQASDVQFLVSQNATCGTANSAFICTGKSNVTFKGDGMIDGNKANQYQHGFWLIGGMEEVYSCSGIACRNCTGINLEWITIQNCNLHGITTWNTTKVNANFIRIYACDNKNWLFYTTMDSSVANCISNDAEYEDGFCLYYGNKRINFSNCVSNNNGRLGMGINSTNSEIQVSNHYAEDNGMNLFIGLSYNCTVNGFVSKDGGQIRHNPTAFYNPVKISSSYNIVINGLIADGMIDYSEAHAQVYIIGDSKNIIFNGGVFCNTDHITTANGYGISIAMSDGIVPSNINLIGVIFHDLKLALGLYNDTTDRMHFRDCKFYNNLGIGTIRDSAKFYDCVGLTLQETGSIEFTSALTLKYGSTHVADYVYPVKERFRFWWLVNPGSSSKVWCDWVSSSDYPANNFRVNLDVAPGSTIQVGWSYDHNLRA